MLANGFCPTVGISDTLTSLEILNAGFLLEGDRENPPLIDFCPPLKDFALAKIVQNTTERTIETTGFCFFHPLPLKKIFLAKSQEYDCRKNSLMKIFKISRTKAVKKLGISESILATEPFSTEISTLLAIQLLP